MKSARGMEWMVNTQQRPEFPFRLSKHQFPTVSIAASRNLLLITQIAHAIPRNFQYDEYFVIHY